MRCKTKTYNAIKLGPLPVDIINKTLGTTLEPGDAWISRAAHEHIARDHADDYDACIAASRDAITNPTYIGQDPKHGRNFNLVKRIALETGNFLLIAISLEVNNFGNYNVRSAYRVSSEKVEQRRRSGHLRVPVVK